MNDITVALENGIFVVKTTDENKVLYKGTLSQCRDWLDCRENMSRTEKK